jgi:hypothetical protein
MFKQLMAGFIFTSIHHGSYNPLLYLKREVLYPVFPQKIMPYDMME